MDRPGSFSTLAEWLPWLETLSPREIVLGLERVAVVLASLDLPRPERVLTVGGTNGKGSSVALLEALFLNAGYATGCYTSPHVRHYNERIRIRGVPAGDARIIGALERVQAVRGEVPLTFFEFGTLAALVAFADAGVDTLILEVGMGGRLDAVNVLEPDACLITNVALDHTAWLGDNVESIGREKAGIMRPGKPVVFGSTDCPASVIEHAADIGATLLRPGMDFQFTRFDDDSGGWSWCGRQAALPALARPALQGQVQYGNAAAVLAMIESLDMPDLLVADLVNSSIGGLTLAGRFQVVPRAPRFVLDVAHNPAAASALAASLDALPDRGKVIAVVGMLADKDVAGFTGALHGLVDDWIAVSVSGPRAARAELLGLKIAAQTQAACRIVPDIHSALEFAATQAGPADTVLITGSFYLVGPALDWLDACQRVAHTG